MTADDPQEIGSWTILARLGAGGMGVVYLAERAGKRAAIKTIRSDLEVDPMFRKRFEREADAMATANSSRIARIIESDLDTTPAFIAFEYYDGPNLREVVQQGGALDPNALQALAIGLAEGLEAIHAEGVVHRDIKPSNVIMTARGPVIIDFGIAAYEASELTQLTSTGEPIGSPTWMSPEYITTGRAAEPGDIFGWAATIQFAATGQPPFGMGATQPLLYRITNVEPTPHGIAGPLGGLVTMALSKRPDSRPSTTDILDTLLPGNSQTGSSPKLRLPLPAPITAGHKMNIGSVPVAPGRVADTVAMPPPPRPHNRVHAAPAPRRSSGRALGVVAVAIVAALFVFSLLTFVVVARSADTSVQPALVPVEPLPVPQIGAPEALVPPGIAGLAQSENRRDELALRDHVGLVAFHFSDQGDPLSDPTAIAAEINDQLRRFLSNDTPLLMYREEEIATMDQAEIMNRRAAFDQLFFYPDMIEVAVDAATGQSPPGSTPTTVSSTLTFIVESAMATNGPDGPSAATPALAALHLDLETLAAVNHTELADPDVQAAFGRFVRAAADQVAAPRI